MVAQLPLQLLGIAFSSASSLWLWMSKHHNWATKTLTLCQFRPVVKVKWCQELLSKGNLCNLNFDSLSNQAHNLQYKWLPKFWLTPTSFWLLTFVKTIQKSNLDFDSPNQGWLPLFTFTNSHLTILTPSEVERLRDNSFDKVGEESQVRQFLIKIWQTGRKGTKMILGSSSIDLAPLVFTVKTKCQNSLLTPVLSLHMS